MKSPLYLLVTPKSTWQERRCCDDRPRNARASRTRTRSARLPRKLRLALPSSFAGFRRRIEPARSADPGTPVVSTTGRSVGTVRRVVVELDTGRPVYAVSPGDADGGRVLLLPVDAVHDRDDVVMIDEGVLDDLERRIA